MSSNVKNSEDPVSGILTPIRPAPSLPQPQLVPCRMAPKIPDSAKMSTQQKSAFTDENPSKPEKAAKPAPPKRTDSIKVRKVASPATSSKELSKQNLEPASPPETSIVLLNLNFKPKSPLSVRPKTATIFKQKLAQRWSWAED